MDSENVLIFFNAFNSYFCISKLKIIMMKKIVSLIAVLLVALSCNNAQKNNARVLTVTIEPQRFFLEKIVGDKFIVNTLVPPGSSPETYEPTPAAMIALGNSQAYFKVGFLGYENAWSESLAQNNPGLKQVDCSVGIETIFDEHAHCNHEHPHHHHEHEGGADPHIWSSAKNAPQFVQNMLEGVIAIDAANADYYRSNFQELLQLISQTDSAATQLLAQLPSRSFIIYHPSLSYFAEDYNLRQYPIEFEGKTPSPKQMKELVDLAKAENIQVVFIQEEFDKKNAEVIAAEIGTKAYVINPLSYDWDKELLRTAAILAGKE